MKPDKLMGLEKDAENAKRTASRRALSRRRPANLKTWLSDFSRRGDQEQQRRRRSIATYVGAFFSFAIAALAIFVLVRTLSHINLVELRNAIAATSTSQILAAAGLTALSFLALTGYDGVALLQLRQRVSYPTTALASFTSYAICFTLGFPLITAGTVRYWIYSEAGLSASKIASLTVIAGVTYWLGMALIIGIGLLVRGQTISNIDHLDPHLNMLIGFGVIWTLLSYLVWVSLDHRKTRIQGFKLELPGFKLTVGQIILGVVDLCSAAGVLYVLLPAPRALDFFTFAAIYVFACALGIASYAPGGIGVFEATMLKAVPVPSKEDLLASLLLFRIIYYLIPFVLALALLGAHEGLRHWQNLREVMRKNEDQGESES
ncbi:MAG TPA: lysylphosphatidylglycerol synthase domain-containing protein [Methylovirgula sp.]|nr:lysylphosphatidylglycerol synthase domain-containing protein [Methylovirgula sp.]